MGQYRHHVFVCTLGKTCARHGADDVYDMLRDEVKAAGLKGQVRVSRAGCMGQCGHGPMVVVYPQDVWYGRVDRRAARRIAEEHLRRGLPVAAHRYVAPPGDNKR
jgi:(2Fe-2S) ferredoxin